MRRVLFNFSFVHEDKSLEFIFKVKSRSLTFRAYLMHPKYGIDIGLSINKEEISIQLTVLTLSIYYE